VASEISAQLSIAGLIH